MADNASSLGRQAQNQILGGLSRVKTSLSVNVVNSMDEFEVDRRTDDWGRWATSRGLEVLRTRINDTRDELDNAARRIFGYQKQLGGVSHPRCPGRALVKVQELEKARVSQEALLASRATTLKKDQELAGVKAEVLSLKAQLGACKVELRAERGRRKQPAVVAPAAAAAVAPVAPVATPVTVTSVLDVPSMAGVYQGVDVDRDDPMVAAGSSPGEIVAARIALLQVWRSLGGYSHQ
jgi:hypothetical protein